MLPIRSYLLVAQCLCLTPCAAAEPVSATSACYHSGTECMNACPTNTFSLECLVNCDKQTTACVKGAEISDRQQRALQQCRALSEKPDYFRGAVDSVYYRKQTALSEGVRDLEKLKQQLNDNRESTLGEPGSARETITYLAQVTKTTANLIESLGGFSGEKSLRKAEQIYEAVRGGRSIYEAVTEDAQKALMNVAIDKIAELNPLLRGAAALKVFSENVAEMQKSPEELEQARSEVSRQIEMIDHQIGSIKKNLEELRRDEVPAAVDSLFNTYQEVRHICAGQTDN